MIGTRSTISVSAEEDEEEADDDEEAGFFFIHKATASISGTTTATNLLSVLSPYKNSWDTSGTWVKIPSICVVEFQEIIRSKK